MSGEEEESDSMGVSYEVLKKRLRDDWTGPDVVYTTVYSWITDYAEHTGKSSVGNFVNYCFTEVSQNHKEDYELMLWFMNLVVHHLNEDENWLNTADDLKDWGRLFLNEEHWEIPPPVWALSREKESDEYCCWLEEKKQKMLKEEKGEEESKESSDGAASPLEEEEKEEKNKEKTEESLESVPTSPLDPNWGKGLPAPSPVVAAPSTPMWRPWEEDVVIDLSAAVQKRKRRSPAAEARSRLRLLEWQERRYRHRLQSELRTTPIRSIEMTKARLINRLEVHAEGVVHSGVEGDGVVEKTVFASNQTNTIVLPQFLKLPVSSFVSVTSSTSRTSDSGCSLDVPTALTPWDPT